jgi:regulator of protease activity HflC (stomatin/prohibitin superfamily)
MDTRDITLTTFALFIIGGLVVLGFWGCPKYNVYAQQKEGEALLAHAQSSREVAVAEAKAKMEAATLLAQADTIRAHGVARSNEIIGKSLKNNEAYLHWLWIDNIEKNPQAVIYVPTEANLPILEAGRRGKIFSETDSSNNK